MPNQKTIGQSLGRSRITSRIPVITNQHINAFSGASISNYSGSLKNVIISQYAGDPDRIYATQRPSIAVFDDASATVTKTQGRGMYWWSKAAAGAGKRYFVNDDTIYDGSYASATAGVANDQAETTTLISGTERVYFVEWSSTNDDYLFIINPEGNQVFAILASDDDAWYNLKDLIDDSAGLYTGTFPSSGDTFDFTGLPITSAKATAAGTDKDMCHGVVVLDKYMFLGYTNGKIYNSSVDDMLDWDSLGFLTAERENDKLLVITKSKDHLVAIGERTTELMYDAGNKTGSPLSPRTDIFWSIGVVSGQNTWTDGDDVYILGMKPQGDFSLFILKDFKLEEIHDETVNSYLKQGRTESSLYTIMSGFSSGSHTYAILTIYNSSNVAQRTIVYDSHVQLWYEWSTELLDICTFAVMDWAIRTTSTPITAEGIFCNGDLFSVGDNFNPIDTTSDSTGYFAEDYDDDTDSGGYDKVTAETTSNIIMEIILDNIEMDSTDRKFMHCLKYVGNKAKSSQTLTVSWTDDDNDNWYSSTIDLQERTQINRMGSFERRKFKISYSGSEQRRMEGLDATYTQGSS